MELINIDSTPVNPFTVPESATDATQDNSTVLYSTDVDMEDMLLEAERTNGSSGEVSEIHRTNSIDIDELMHSPQFDWKVVKEPLSRFHKTNHRNVFTHQSITRSDNGRDLGIVRAGSYLLHNAGFFEFIRPLAESEHFTLSTVALIDGGRTIAAVLKNNHIGRLEAFKDDPMEGVIIARATRSSVPLVHIGSLLWRLVCKNGMVALDYDRHKIDPKSNIAIEGRRITNMLERSGAKAKEAMSRFQDMANYRMSAYESDQYRRRSLGLVWDDPELLLDTPEDHEHHRLEMQKNARVLGKVESSHEIQAEMLPPELRETLYHEYQSITGYVTHHRSLNSKTKFKELHWGTGRKIIDRGFKVATELMDAQPLNQVAI
jgi:hypothetical protein